MGGFEDKVRSVLSDTMNLPDDFLSMIPQYVAQNPVPLARTTGTRITSGQRTSNVSSAGTTFAAGADVLASPLTFTADGNNSYVVKIQASNWQNSTSGVTQFLVANLDGADEGRMAAATVPGANFAVPCAGDGYLGILGAGVHTINVRLMTTGSTATVAGGVGGSGNDMPIVVTLEVA